MEKLIKKLVREGILEKKEIIKSFRHIDRKDFVLSQYRKMAYEDIPLPVGYNQTISQPTTVAFMLGLLNPEKNQKILEIGSGSGWVAALLAEIVGPTGKIFGVEIIPELVKFGKDNLQKYNFSNAKILLAGKKLGLPKKAPFDAIIVSAAADKLPMEFVDQLKIDGTLVIPIKNSIYKITKKSDSEIISQELPGFVFVPLVEK